MIAVKCFGKALGNLDPVATTVASTRLPRRYAPRNDKLSTHDLILFIDHDEL